MADSSDSEEFYDAEEFTPVKGSKRSSVCSKSLSLNEEKDKETSPKTQHKEISSPQNAPVVHTTAPAQDDNAIIKNVVQDRRRFQELRRCLQTEEDDDTPESPGELDQHSCNLEQQPFKVIAHDAMSLQSMTSLGRIGRILSGAYDSQSNFKESVPAPSTTARELSTRSDDPVATERTQIAAPPLASSEPDVIASTKANSLKWARAGLTVTAPLAAQPVAPPRRKKRNKLHGSQSLSTTDGDNLSVCTNDTDDYYFNPTRKSERADKPPPLDALLSESPLSSLCPQQSLSLPSPASTIESLTREFQDSLELCHTKFESSPTVSDARESRRSTERSLNPDKILDINDALHGVYLVSATDEDKSRAGGSRTHSETGGSRTHSETRAHPALGSHGRSSCSRRRSAGDEAVRPLTDTEILDQVTVLNLDTGERMPLSEAEHKLPQCINPLSLHIMRLTSEYIGRDNDEENARETDEESESVCAGGTEDETKESKRDSTDRQRTGIKKKTERLKRFFGTTVKKTVDAAKSLAQEVTHARHKEDVADIADDVRGEHNIKLKASNSHKGPYDFDGCVRHVQELGSAHVGAVWCCKFSVCGQLLATAGQDRLLRVWVTRDAQHAFQELRTNCNAEAKCSPPPPQAGAPPGPGAIFSAAPFCVYAGHTSDLLDVSWSKNNFILSSSMDKTVRLWHISRSECLCCFQHIDFVTAIVFHPRDDCYFLSGSLDGKLRLWNIPDKKVEVWNEVDGKTKLITAANFFQNGKFAVVGTYDGRCIFYTADQLKYHTQIDVRSTRGKNSTGRKISGVEPMPNDDKILVTSNDSRIRLYDLRDLNLSCKYKGYVNVSSQIKASFSHDGKYIVSGSENQCIYIWKTHHDYSKFTSVRRDRNDFWEGIKAHNAVVTCAVFAPNPDHMIRMISEREEEERAKNGTSESEKDEVRSQESGGMVSSSQTGHVLVSADFNGCIKVFVHKAKPKHSSLPASALC